MGVKLKDFQQDCVKNLSSGKVLAVGVGGGKSIMSLYWYITGNCRYRESSDSTGKNFQLLRGSPDLYIITTAKKRNSGEWVDELSRYHLCLGDNGKLMANVKVHVDSWNNIGKYEEVTNAVFIFDEQRAIGNGSWSKSFIHLAKHNRWIMLSATPGDQWADWCPVMIADGFYRNRTEYFRRHAVYSRYSKYPRVDKWIETDYLERYRAKILVTCDIPRETERHYEDIVCAYDKTEWKKTIKDRWNPIKNEPFLNASGMFAYLRRLVNTHDSRLEHGSEVVRTHRKVVIFYTLTAELDEILKLEKTTGIEVYQLNGAVHDPLPTGKSWVYAVQYNAGSEGWNCTTSNTILFWDLPYSYRQYEQAAGRIDRLNTKYKDLYYYRMRSHAPLDLSISRALANKKDFNLSGFARSHKVTFKPIKDK